MCLFPGPIYKQEGYGAVEGWLLNRLTPLREQALDGLGAFALADTNHKKAWLHRLVCRADQGSSLVIGLS